MSKWPKCQCRVCKSYSNHTARAKPTASKLSDAPATWHLRWSHDVVFLVPSLDALEGPAHGMKYAHTYTTNTCMTHEPMWNQCETYFVLFFPMSLILQRSWTKPSPNRSGFCWSSPGPKQETHLTAAAGVHNPIGISTDFEMFGYFPVPYLDDFYRFYSANHPLRFFLCGTQTQPPYQSSGTPCKGCRCIQSCLPPITGTLSMPCTPVPWGGQQAGFGCGGSPGLLPLWKAKKRTSLKQYSAKLCPNRFQPDWRWWNDGSVRREQEAGSSVCDLNHGLMMLTLQSPP